jgi:hypothetical protein
VSTATKPRLLDAATILAKAQLPHEDVEVPEWGGTVRVRALSGTERDRYEAGFVMLRGNTRTVTTENFRSRLVAMACIDEDGNRLFTDAQVKELGLLNAGALDRVFAVAQRLSGLRDEDMKELVTVLGNAPSGEAGSA